MHSLSCSIWDPVPWPGIEPGPPALGAWSLNHWATREIPSFHIFYDPSGGSLTVDLKWWMKFYSFYSVGTQQHLIKCSLFFSLFCLDYRDRICTSGSKKKVCEIWWRDSQWKSWGSPNSEEWMWKWSSWGNSSLGSSPVCTGYTKGKCWNELVFYQRL